MLGIAETTDVGQREIAFAIMKGTVSRGGKRLESAERGGRGKCIYDDYVILRGCTL